MIDFAKNSTYSAHLACNINSTITSVNSFGYSSIKAENEDSSSSCSTGSVTSLTISKTDGCNPIDYLDTNFTKYCKGNSTCKLDIATSPVIANCTSVNKAFASDYYFSYSCYNDNIFLPFNNSITRSQMAYVAVFIDIFSMLVIVISIAIINFAIYKRKKEYVKENVLISTYTLHIKNLKITGNQFQSELSDLLSHLKKVIQTEAQAMGEAIFLVKECRNSKFSPFLLNLSTEVNNDSVGKTLFYEVNYPTVSPIVLGELKKINKFKAMLAIQTTKQNTEMIDDLNKKIGKSEESMKQELADGNLGLIREIFVTTRTQRIANFIFKLFNKSKSERCCIICCCKYNQIKHRYYKGQWLNMTMALDEPSNINWENMSFSSCRRFGRKVFSYFFSFIIIIASFGVIIGSKAAESTFRENFNINTDCTSFVVTDQSLKNEVLNTTLTSRERVNMYCYCQASYNTNGFDKTNSIEIIPGVKLCSDWLNYIITTNAINYGIVIIVPVINAILLIVLKLLTQFERNKTLAADLLSNFVKVFVMQSINTGVVILLVNIYSKSVKDNVPRFPILTGNYKDLDPSWYVNVGTTIILCMIINIFTPHISAFIFKLMKDCKICCDKGCTSNQKTKCTTIKEYKAKYVGAEFIIEGRYAQISTSIFVSMFYSSGMPIMYVLIFFFIFATYYVDKYLFLRFYKKPKQFDPFINNIFTHLTLITVLIHMFVGIWIYGNPYLLIDNSANSIDVVGASFRNIISLDPNSYANEIVSRFTLKHNAILLCCIILLGVYLVLRYTIFNIVRSVFGNEEQGENSDDCIEIGACKCIIIMLNSVAI